MEEKKIITWETPEYIYREKSNDWFWAFGIITFSGAIASAILGNVLLALLIIISAIVIFLHANKEPRILNVELTERFIRIDNKKYLYEDIESFGINEDNENAPVLIFKLKKLTSPFVSVFIKNENIDEVRDVLNEHLPEEDHDIGLIQTIIEFLGF